MKNMKGKIKVRGKSQEGKSTDSYYLKKMQ